MADLISSLADQIIALINSKPSSPRKEEVEAVLRDTIDPQLDRVYDNIMLASMPMFVVKPGIATEEIKAGDPVVFDHPWMTTGSQGIGNATFDDMLAEVAQEEADEMAALEPTFLAAIEAAKDEESKFCGVVGHRWRGYDAFGLLCEKGSPLDNGGPYNCPCGAVKTD